MSATNDDETREPEASAQELAEAEALARALERTGGEGADEPAEVAELLRVAERVRAAGGQAPPLEPARRDAMLDEAVARLDARRRPARLRAAIALAAAATILVAIGLFLVIRPGSGRAVLPAEALAAPTDALFDGPFPEDQSPADRVDRILQARTRGYFAAQIAARSGRGGRAPAEAGRASLALAGSPAPW